MSQDFYTLDGNKIENLIEVYDHKRYTFSKIARDLKDCYNSSQYEIIKAYSVKHSNNYEEFVSTNGTGKRQAVKIVVEKQ